MKIDRPLAAVGNLFFSLCLVFLPGASTDQRPEFRMQARMISWGEASGWRPAAAPDEAGIVLYFGGREWMANGSRYRELRQLFPHAHVVGCSTGGQIHDDDVSDDEVTAVALRFDATRLKVVSEAIGGAEQSRACGEKIGARLFDDDLSGVIVLSDGLNVNGSELVAGITNVIGLSVPLTGGLAGDGADFRETLVSADDVPRSNLVAAVGFYGPRVRFGHGSAAGWDVFGPRRRITRSAGNVLYELDGEPALDLYEKYLGDEASGLPGSALLFPLQIYSPQRPDHPVVRTVLAIDRDAGSMTFAGDMQQGSVAQLMRGNFDRLAAGAGEAARLASRGKAETDGGDTVAILVSCIGRRLLMGQRVTEELQAATAELGPRTARLGFYSYGEIAPHAGSGACELHNQTMTVTVIGEASR